MRKYNDLRPNLLTLSSILREQEQLEADAREALPYVSAFINTILGLHQRNIRV